jgi:hypothetical protein
MLYNVFNGKNIFFINYINKVIKITNNYIDSSETMCDKIYNFDNYLKLKPEHKNKVNTSFLE